MFEEELRGRGVLIWLEDNAPVLKTDYLEEMAVQAPQATLRQTAQAVARQFGLTGAHWTLCRCSFGKAGAQTHPISDALTLGALRLPLTLALVDDEDMQRRCRALAEEERANAGD
ncbi:MAG TPA: hypothetical protein IAA32_00800 [Candidatus Butyricicoccus stercorigallinarum]|nr:hypothetical protein [Candidatus Butyricicoccus stercorigallinarum]